MAQKGHEPRTCCNRLLASYFDTSINIKHKLDNVRLINEVYNIIDFPLLAMLDMGNALLFYLNKLNTP